MTSGGDCTRLFGRDICLVEGPDLSQLVSVMDQTPCATVFFCNVHMLMLSQEDPMLAAAMDNADFVFADGVPIRWLQKRVTNSTAKTVWGWQLMEAICRHAVNNGQTIGLIGSTSEVMSALVENLETRFEGLSISYHYSPPYSPGELLSTKEELQSINAAGPTWLFVGLGCPKQEKWVNRYKSDLNCKILAVGAAFDWLAGASRKPPDWMEKRGLAWLYRLLQNPKKMWYRYLIYNTKFVIKSAGLLLKKDRY